MFGRACETRGGRREAVTEGPKEKEAHRVICTMKRDFKASDVKVGDTVKLQGTCKGHGVVQLDKCEGVK